MLFSFREERLWGIAVIAVALLVAIPLVSICLMALSDPGSAWRHIVQTRLAVYAANTALLALSVTLAATVLGVIPAWLLTAYRVPGGRLLSWAMLLPLAVPAYISAYAYTDLLQFSGPLRSMLRGAFGPEACAWIPNPRSLPGAAGVLAFALAPYVFVAARQAFAAHGFYATQVARTLGRGPGAAFLTVGLPLATPAVLGGASLVLMETLADFGVAEYCAIDTFATGVYRSWLGLDAPGAAARLSLVMMLIVSLLLGVVHVARVRTAVPHAASNVPVEPTRISGIGAAIATATCAAPIVLGFAVPTLTLIVLATGTGSDDATRDFMRNTGHTVAIAGVAAAVAVILAIMTAYGRRVRPTLAVRCAARLTVLGYAIPGTVIAVGVLIPLTTIDHGLNVIAGWLFTERMRPGLVITGSMAAVIIGCQTRFLAVAVSTVDSALLRVRRSIDDAARTLGVGPTATLFRVHLPICRAGLMIGGILVFADVAKELPMTLLLRPFNFDTLAVRAYQFAAEERLREAAAPALGVIAIGVCAVIAVAVIIDASDRVARKEALDAR